MRRHSERNLKDNRIRRQEAMEKIRQDYYKKNNIPIPPGETNAPLWRSTKLGGVVVCDGEHEQSIEDEDIIHSLVIPHNDLGLDVIGKS